MARTAKITNANVAPLKNAAGLVGNTPVRAQDFNDLVGDYISSSDANAQTIASAATVSGNLTANGAFIGSSETVAAGNGGGNAVALSTTTLTSFVTTATNSSHVSLADGVAGQIKIIVHKTRANTVDLVITPANFGPGSTLTSDSAARMVILVFDGTNWQATGELTGTAEFAIA